MICLAIGTEPPPGREELGMHAICGLIRRKDWFEDIRPAEESASNAALEPSYGTACFCLLARRIIWHIDMELHALYMMLARAPPLA